MTISKNSLSINLAPNDYLWKYSSDATNSKFEESRYLAYKISPVKPTGNLIDDLRVFDNYRIDRKLESVKLETTGSLEAKIERYSWFLYNELKKQGSLALDQNFISDFYGRFFYNYGNAGLNQLAEDIISKNSSFDLYVTQRLIDTFFMVNLDYEVNNGGFSQFFYNGNIAKYLVVEQAIQTLKPQPYLEIYTRLMAEIRGWTNNDLDKFYEAGIFHDDNKESIPLANKINEIGGSIPFLKENNYYEIKPKLAELIVEYMNQYRQEFEKFMNH